MAFIHRLLFSAPMRLSLPFVGLGLFVLLVPLPISTTSTVRNITLDASQFEFAPGRIEVNQGDHVLITLAATDVVHGFYLDGYGLEQRVVPGVSQQISFIAEQSGKFRYRCSVSCGPLHPFMIGELVVNQNFPFWRAVGLMIVGIAGMLTHLWRFGRSEM
jgi:heme/copper-type cytochrome/quinol oxidase subunit 2